MKSNVTKLLAFQILVHLATTDKIAKKDLYLTEEKVFNTKEKF